MILRIPGTGVVGDASLANGATVTGAAVAFPLRKTRRRETATRSGNLISVEAVCVSAGE